MTKEEQMKAIGDIIAKIIKRDCVSIFDEDDDGEVEMISTISVNGIGKAIYECGYRKAEEVRKETAREILNLVYQRVKDISGKSEYLLDDESIYEDSSFVNVLNNIGQKYSVEVKE